jgi:hypothetical protein
METILEGLNRFGNQPVMETILEGLNRLEYMSCHIGLARLLYIKGQSHSARRQEDHTRRSQQSSKNDQAVRRHRRSEIPRSGSPVGPAVRCS